MSLRLLGPAVAVLALVAATGAQDRPSPETKRAVYFVKHAAATDLADTLASRFKGTAEIQAAPENTSNCLLINAPPAVFGEVMKLVNQLDRPTQAVAVEIMVVELPEKKAKDGGKKPDEKNFAGTIEDVAKRLDALKRKGQVANFKRLQFTTFPGRFASIQLTSSKPFVLEMLGRRRRHEWKWLGTIITVKPHVGGDGTIMLDLAMTDNRSRESATDTVGTDESGKAIPAAEFISTKVSSKISVPSGAAVLARVAKVTLGGAAQRPQGDLERRLGGGARHRWRPSHRGAGGAEIGRCLNSPASVSRERKESVTLLPACRAALLLLGGKAGVRNRIAPAIQFRTPAAHPVPDTCGTPEPL